MKSKRLKRLTDTLSGEGRLPYCISSLINIQYLTGFQGTAACLIVNEGESFFISDSRYEEYARSILPRSLEFVLQTSTLAHSIREVMKRLDSRRLFLEEHSLTLSSYLLLKKELRGITLKPGGDAVNHLRLTKDDNEIAALKKAAAITDRCVSHLLSMIRPGITEWDVAVEIEYFYRTNGCRKTSFDSIVASGSNSSMPHYTTSPTKRIQRGDILLIDMGCVYDSYNSDLTRTIFVNSIEPEFKRIYEIVRQAQEKAIDRARPGVLTGTLDGMARDHITQAGYGDAFGHSLGHGVGLEVHELPAVRSAGDVRLRKNMVITIEPGIYLPERGGVRIEDMVLITPHGCEVLTRSSKKMTVV